jgi:hypothetical protein
VIRLQDKMGDCRGPAHSTPQGETDGRIASPCPVLERARPPGKAILR